MWPNFIQGKYMEYSILCSAHKITFRIAFVVVVSSATIRLWHTCTYVIIPNKVISTRLSDSLMYKFNVFALQAYTITSTCGTTHQYRHEVSLYIRQPAHPIGEMAQVQLSYNAQQVAAVHRLLLYIPCAAPNRPAKRSSWCLNTQDTHYVQGVNK